MCVSAVAVALNTFINSMECSAMNYEQTVNLLNFYEVCSCVNVHFFVVVGKVGLSALPEHYSSI